MTRFLTHDNGGRPFLVDIINNNEVDIYIQIFNEDYKQVPIGNGPFFEPPTHVQIETYIVPEYVQLQEGQFVLHPKPQISKLISNTFSIQIEDEEGFTKWIKVLSFIPKQIFVGHSPLIRVTEFSGGHGPDFLGNSILLYLGSIGSAGSKKYKYVFIGHVISIFETDEPIINYVSPVGNSDVPYPYAETENKIYLMIENVFVFKEDLNTEEDTQIAEDTGELIWDPYYNDAVEYHKFEMIPLNKEIKQNIRKLETYIQRHGDRINVEYPLNYLARHSLNKDVTRNIMNLYPDSDKVPKYKNPPYYSNR